MNASFYDFFWHDASLKFMYVDRNHPGKNDTVKLGISWPEERGSSIFEFHDCYALKANMNFGILVDESILTVELITNSQELNFIRENWLEMGVNLHSLKCYKILTNSTNSTIEIYSLGFRAFDKS